VSQLGCRVLPSKHLQHNLQRAQQPGGLEAAEKPAPRLKAVVRFASTEEAQRAIRKRDNTYLGNSLITMRLLP
jgi:hypothetical protein